MGLALQATATSSCQVIDVSDNLNILLSRLNSGMTKQDNIVMPSGGELVCFFYVLRLSPSWSRVSCFRMPRH